jgi:hypothetical protein
MAQVDPEFKPQYSPQKKERKRGEEEERKLINLTSRFLT